MLVLGLCLFFTRLVGRRFGRRSSCRRSLIRCCRRSSVVLSSVVRSVVGCRSLPSSAGRWSLVILPVIGRPFSLPGPSASELSRDSLPNSLPPRSSRLSSSASRATHCQPAFLLSASVDSSDNRSGCLARASLRFPPPGFRSSASASWLPLVGFRLLASARRLPPLGPLRSSTSPPRLRGSLLLLGFPQASRDRLVPSCPRRLAGLGRPLSGLSRAIPSGRLASPEGFLLYEFRSSGSFPRFLLGPFLGPFWVPSGSLLGPFWGRLSWPPSHTSPVGQFTLAVSRLFMTCRGSGPIHTSRDRAPPSLPRPRGFSPHFVRAPPSLLFTSCTSFLSPILSLP